MWKLRFRRRSVPGQTESTRDGSSAGSSDAETPSGRLVLLHGRLTYNTMS